MSEVKVCPDCQSVISIGNPLVSEREAEHGSCVECYDPTPAGPEYSAGFEMNH